MRGGDGREDTVIAGGETGNKFRSKFGKSPNYTNSFVLVTKEILISIEALSLFITRKPFSFFFFSLFSFSFLLSEKLKNMFIY